MSNSAVLMVNLGSPDAPTENAVKRYLNEFLMDGYVLDVPYLIRALIVKGFILPNRPKKSAQAYHSIWTENGSPLVYLSEQLKKKIEAQSELPIYLGMRYGHPSLLSQLKQAHSDNIKEILLVPLYPHYAMSTIKTTVEKIQTLNKTHQFNFSIKVLPPFYQHPDYIKALTQVTQPYLEKGFDHLVFSYHGLPERHLRKTDPTKAHCLHTPDCCLSSCAATDTCYRSHTMKTTHALAHQLNLKQGQYSIAYQSRLGQDAWLKPYTDQHLKALAAKNIKRVVVICPAFVTDCLETLEEIGIQAKQDFIAAGGESLTLVPCLNDHSAWVDTLSLWFKQSWQNYPMIDS